MFRGWNSGPPPPRAPPFGSFRMQFRGAPPFPRPRGQPDHFRGVSSAGPPPPVQQPTPEAAALLFVGNIAEQCPDSLMREMLELCGPIESWKRMQGADGRFPPFGFCGFLQHSSAVLAIRVLDGFLLGEKRLNVKADEKVQKILVDYCVRDRATKNLPPKPFGQELEPDEGDQKEIGELRTKIQSLIAAQQPSLIGKDKDDAEKSRNGESKASKSHDRSGHRTEEHHSSRRRSRTSHRRSRSRSYSRSSRSRSSSGSRTDRSRSTSSYSSSRSHSYSNGRNSSISEDRTAKVDGAEDSDAAEERRERKREQRRKDEEYLRQLKKFEEREKRMAKQYAREDEANQSRKKEMQREAKKLIQFLEDYNDQVDDEKYYKNSAFLQRKRDYATERERDNRDRQAEAKEIAEAKAEVMRGQNGNSNRKRRLSNDTLSPSPHIRLGQKTTKEENGNAQPFRYSFVEEQRTTVEISPLKNDDWTPLSDQPSTSTGDIPKGQQSKVVTTLQSKVLSQMSGVFGEDEAEEEVHVIKKKIKPFEITAQDRIESMTTDERKQMVKELIDAIPTNKTELFKYAIEWEHLDEALITQRIKPWVEKKIREYIGDEEPSLVSFICERVQARSEPTRLLGDLAMILDEEADSFMTKLWRLIAFQTEAKKVGLNVNKP